jgi:Na+/H+ antiporter NhaD/arsenite permease-like protein
VSPLGALLDLPALFVGASAIRALLGAGLAVHGGFVGETGRLSVLAAGVDNLPAAAAVHAIGAAPRWAAILSMAIGPNLLVTGSLATLICRRIARDGGVEIGAVRFSVLGLAAAPVQLAAAAASLWAAGVIR